MKIALPVNDDKKTICSAFGRTAYFIVYDLDTDQYEVIDNSEARNSMGGAGIAASQLLIDLGVKVVISPRLGENAAKVLRVAQIPMYANESELWEENVALFKEGKCRTDTDVHPGYHNHGGM